MEWYLSDMMFEFFSDMRNEELSLRRRGFHDQGSDPVGPTCGKTLQPHLRLGSHTSKLCEFGSLSGASELILTNTAWCKGLFARLCYGFAQFSSLQHFDAELPPHLHVCVVYFFVSGLLLQTVSFYPLSITFSGWNVADR